MNSDKLNSIIKKKAKGSNDLSLHLHQMFFFEHVLMRLEKSRYRDNIILKGGVLLSSIIGSDMRTTKDIDATLKSISLDLNNISKIHNENLIKAIKNTFNKRNTNLELDYLKEVYDLIKDSSILKRNFVSYKEKLGYANFLEFDDTVVAIKKIIDILEKEIVVI